MSKVLEAARSFDDACAAGLREMADARSTIDAVPEGCPIPRATHDKLFRVFGSVLASAHNMMRTALADAAPAPRDQTPPAEPAQPAAQPAALAAPEGAAVSADAPTVPQRPASAAEVAPEAETPPPPA